MTVSEDDVRSLARLAHLDLTAAEIAEARAHLQVLLGYVGRLQAVSVVDASTAPAPQAVPGLRDDVARPGLPREVLLAGAPATSSGLFEVPRVLSHRGPGAAPDAEEPVP